MWLKPVQFIFFNPFTKVNGNLLLPSDLSDGLQNRKWIRLKPHLLVLQQRDNDFGNWIFEYCFSFGICDLEFILPHIVSAIIAFAV